MTLDEDSGESGLVCMRCYEDLPDDHAHDVPCPHCGGKISMCVDELTADHPLLEGKIEIVAGRVATKVRSNGAKWVFEDGDRLLEQLKTHVMATPPRCVNGLVASKARLPFSVAVAGDVATFAISCPCGTDKGVILGHRVRDTLGHDSDDLLSPLAWRCCNCKRRHEFLDTDIHGFHAACGFGPGRHAKGKGRRKPWSCPKCQDQSIKLVLGFAFWNYDLFLNAVEDAETDLDSLEVFNHPEDFFNEVYTCACCTRCKAKTRFTDFGKL